MIYTPYAFSDIYMRASRISMEIAHHNYKLAAELTAATAAFYDRIPLVRAFAEVGKVNALQMEASARLFRKMVTQNTPAPEYNITGVTEKKVRERDFYNLLHFRETGAKNNRPKLLLVAPMSGHYGSFFRSTIKTLCCDYDVSVLDWKNPRDISKECGVFDFERYMTCVIETLSYMGPDTHVIGISQSTVPLLAASAVLAQQNHAGTPKSITLIGGPVDTRHSKSYLHDFVRNTPISWFKRNVIDTIPMWYKGKNREVYPGTTQLVALMIEGKDKHRQRLNELYRALEDENLQSAQELEDFYKDYFAVMDLSAPFFLETLQHTYKNHSLANGTLSYKGEKVDLGALKHTALLTIEGAKDGITLAGETHAAQDLCPNIDPAKRARFTHPEFGHYGIALGARFETGIAPHIRAFITRHHIQNLPKPSLRKP